jgi:hypothetical protein
MSGNNPPVQANVANQVFTPEAESFGVPIVGDTVSADVATAWSILVKPYTLEVTPNNYKSALTALGMTASDSHWKHCATMFAQKSGRKVTKVILGRRVTPVAKVIQVTVGEFADGNYSIQLEAETPLLYNAAGKTAAQIAAELVLLFAGNPLATAVVADVDKIDITVSKVGFDLAVTLASPTDLLTQAITTQNVGIGGDLEVWRAENPDWFDIFEGSHSWAAIAEAFKWAQGNAAHAWMETNDAAVKSNAAGNIAAYLKAKGYTDGSIRYHHTGAELFTAALGGHVLAFEPGQVQVSHRQLVGITKKNYGAEAGVTTALGLNNVGYYDSTGGGSTLFNYVPSGSFIEMERNRWVVRARIIAKNLARLIGNNITAYTTEEGVSAARASTLEALNELATEGGTGYIRRDTIDIDVTPIEELPAEEQAALKIGGITWSAKVRIGTNEIETTGYLSI